MRQWTTLMDGVDSLQLQDVPQPTDLKDDEVLVKISRVSLNYRDIQLITGTFKDRYPAPSHPLIPCSDASGIIHAIGPSSSHWKPGDRVFSLVRPNHLTGPTLPPHHAQGIGIPQPGVLSEFRVLPASGLMRVPEYMTFEEACTLPIAAVTAWMALNWDQPIGKPRRGGDVTVLIQGTGGVSLAALQQAKALGLTTIITSSSDEKLALAKSLGATHTINYKTHPSWSTPVLTLTSQRGADIILEIGGPGTMSESLRAIAPGGTISAVGIVTGSIEVEGQMAVGLQLIGKNAALKGINIGPRDRVEEMLRVYEEAGIRPVVGRVFDFEDFRGAAEEAKKGDVLGKVVVKVE